MRNSFLAGLLSGVLGGLFGAYLLSHFGRLEPRAQPVVTRVSQQEIISNRIALVDDGGKVRAQLAMSPSGGPGIFFYDSQGRSRLELGLYSPAESEYPFVVLNDTQQQAAGIFRLFGGHETPVVVLKNRGRDRSIYGLNPNSTEPFLVNYSNESNKASAFGDF